MTVETVPGRTEGQPDSDRVWNIETNGINPIPDSERHGNAKELFWIWCASNISILGITYGAFLVAFYGLNLWQGLLAGALGTILSFLLVGYVSLAGMLGGAPTLVLSRAPFGVTGNAIPTTISYLSLVGWEIILVALATLAAQTVLDRIGAPTGDVTLAISFAVIAAITIGIGLLGHATIVTIQTWFTWAFAAMTVVFLVLMIPEIDWDAVSALPSGSFWRGFVGGTSIIMAGLGIGWVNAAADYSRYLPRRSRPGAVVGWTVLGGSVAPLILIGVGVLLTANNPDLAGADPIGALAEPLPTWFLIPYLLTAVGGLLAGAVLDIYSSGLNLLALGVRLPRYQSVAIDGVLMLVGNIYILFFAQDLVGPFTGFLITLGVPLAAWASIFLVDMFRFRRRDGYDETDLYRPSGRYGRFHWPGLIAFGVATFIGLGLIVSTASIFSWVGYLLRWFGWDDGALAGSSIGVFVGFLLAGSLYAILTPSRSSGTDHSLT
ncbi:MAG TPA: cytosine permease [Actinomycetota bacterium]|nr:cytosine permease [Actinomycetota bacterium]